ncbi:putative transcriptional regulator tpeD [Wolffia australiana]
MVSHDGGLVLGDAIARVRQVVTSIRASTQRRQQYVKTCNDMGKNPNQLPLDCLTRWNSTHDMLHAALEKREVVYLMALQIMSVTDKDIRISREEWDMLADFRDILGPSYRTTKYVSGSKTVRVVEVIRIMKVLLRHVDMILSKFDMATIFSSGRRMTAGQIASIRRACESMKLKMLKYEMMISTNRATTTAAILDPFNKGALLESSDLQESLAFVRQLMPQHSQHEPMYNDLEDEDWLTELIDGTPPARGKERRVPALAEELEAYLQSTERKDNETALGWWACIGARSYPRLATLAQEFLSVCATSAPAERLFSAERAVVTFKRACLVVTVKC